MKDRKLAIFVSFFAGATSLAQETIWIRLLSFASNNSPQTISIVLAVFLIGIVTGSYIGKRICLQWEERNQLWDKVSLTLLCSGFIDIGAPVLLAHMENMILMPLAMLLFVYLTSLSKAILFPIVHHIGSRMNSGRIGRSVSMVYFLNIIGATVSPIVIGFWLLDRVGSVEIMKSIGMASVLLGIWIGKTSNILQNAGAFVLASTLIYIPKGDLIKKLAFGSDLARIPFIIENRHGIIHTTYNPVKGDGVYGGNIYDGRINVDPFLNSNGIRRAYLLSTLHPASKRILEIGLSGGAWARVLSAMPGVERIDIVEINPGYIELIKKYPLVNTILSDPRIHIHIDDGRRWLQRYEGPPFDLIVINNTYHWRAFATNMLSKEFMFLVKKNLSRKGIYAFNSTGSLDALFTAFTVFSNAYQWRGRSFVYAARHDFRQFDRQRGVSNLKKCLEKLGYGPNIKGWNELISMLSNPKWLGVKDLEEYKNNELMIISDWNLVPEYRHGRYKIWPF